MSEAICHDLKQPMQAVTGYAELLMMEISEKEAIYNTVCAIKDQIDRMAMIIRKLMKVTNYETME